MSIVRDSIKIELKEAAKISKEYSDKIKSAKTKTKQKYYHKKLKKNNEIVASLILALDKIEKQA